jgi:hypothetical protein
MERLQETIGAIRALGRGMWLLRRLSQYHSESRPAFVLFAEIIGFTGVMTGIVGLGILFSLFQ